MYTIAKIAGHVIIVLMVFTITSCTEDFNQINTDPNNATNAPASNVFGDGIITVANNQFGERLDIYYAGSYAEHTAAIGLGDYEFRVGINNGIWNSQYRAMTYFVDAQRLAEESGNTNLQAAALMMKAWTGQKTTDMWGKIPYTEAISLEEGVANPNYDTQETVYTTLLSELQSAAEMFGSGSGDIGPGDFIFNGDVEKWEKFTNSTRLRVAIRMSNVDPNTASSVLSEILNNPSEYPVMTSNGDNAYLWYPGVPPDRELWMERLGTADNKGDQYRTNHTLVNMLKSLNDPRLPLFVDENEYGEYNGYEFGPGQRQDTMNNGNNVSHIGDPIGYDPDGYSPFMNVAEVHFIKAEAYERGLVTGDARAAYEAGITASLQEHGVSDGDIATYLSETGVAWDSGSRSNLEKIYVQKWISLIKQSVEAWSEVRRTDVPLMDTPASPYHNNHNRPPFRLPYPADEKDFNENFPSDVNEVDIFYGTQVWFDTRTGVQ
ncbi:SusD/RagB family nutrient-binding outer membrane lipoprotein [Halalkalibaculum sp. DA384]|uniref:SusD/RagB family nutrient-binding outer membrane lipoprotein n=1 Tax=Halalkalibaculum sp. DA384 TaxID=3373606 RepID=UPI0037544E35